jgi:hypothetical protein
LILLFFNLLLIVGLNNRFLSVDNTLKLVKNRKMKLKKKKSFHFFRFLNSIQ